MPSIEGPLVQFVYYVMRVACCFVSTATEIREQQEGEEANSQSVSGTNK